MYRSKPSRETLMSLVMTKRFHVVLELLLKSVLDKVPVEASNAAAWVAKGSVDDSGYHPAAKAGRGGGWCMCS